MSKLAASTEARSGRFELLSNYDAAQQLLYIKLGSVRALPVDHNAVGSDSSLFLRISVLPTSRKDIDSAARTLFNPVPGPKQRSQLMRGRTHLHQFAEELAINEEFVLDIDALLAMDNAARELYNYRLHVALVSTTAQNPDQSQPHQSRHLVTNVPVDKTTGSQPGSSGLSFDFVEGKGHTITRVMPGSSSALTGQVEAGMTIIAVNNTDCRNLLKHETALLIRSGDAVMLTVLSKQKHEVSRAEPEQGQMQKTLITVPMETTSKKYGVNLQLEHEPGTGYRVSKIPAESRAQVSISAKADPYKSGEMDVDMVLVAINGVDVRYFPKHEVDLMIKKSKKTVNLTFQRDVNDGSNVVGCSSFPLDEFFESVTSGDRPSSMVMAGATGQWDVKSEINKPIDPMTGGHPLSARMEKPGWFWLFPPSIGIVYSEPVAQMEIVQAPRFEARVTSTAETPACVEIDGRDYFNPNSAMNDVYVMMPTKFFSNTVVYRGHSNNLWLYYMSASSKWAVGYTIGSLLPLAHAKGPPQSPETIHAVGQWHVHSGELDEFSVIVDGIGTVHGAYMPDTDASCVICEMPTVLPPTVPIYTPGAVDETSVCEESPTATDMLHDEFLTESAVGSLASGDAAQPAHIFDLKLTNNHVMSKDAKWWSGGAWGESILEPTENDAEVTVKGEGVLWTKSIGGGTALVANDGLTVSMKIAYARLHDSSDFVVGISAGGKAAYLSFDGRTLEMETVTTKTVKRAVVVDDFSDKVANVHGDGRASQQPELGFQGWGVVLKRESVTTFVTEDTTTTVTDTVYRDWKIKLSSASGWTKDEFHSGESIKTWDEMVLKTQPEEAFHVTWKWPRGGGNGTVTVEDLSGNASAHELAPVTRLAFDKDPRVWVGGVDQFTHMTIPTLEIEAFIERLEVPLVDASDNAAGTVTTMVTASTLWLHGLTQGKEVAFARLASSDGEYHDGDFLVEKLSQGDYVLNVNYGGKPTRHTITAGDNGGLVFRQQNYLTLDDLISQLGSAFLPAGWPVRLNRPVRPRVDQLSAPQPDEAPPDVNVPAEGRSRRGSIIKRQDGASSGRRVSFNDDEIADTREYDVEKPFPDGEMYRAVHNFGGNYGDRGRGEIKFRIGDIIIVLGDKEDWIDEDEWYGCLGDDEENEGQFPRTAVEPVDGARVAEDAEAKLSMGTPLASAETVGFESESLAAADHPLITSQLPAEVDMFIRGSKSELDNLVNPDAWEKCVAWLVDAFATTDNTAVRNKARNLCAVDNFTRNLSAIKVQGGSLFEGLREELRRVLAKQGESMRLENLRTGWLAATGKAALKKRLPIAPGFKNAKRDEVRADHKAMMPELFGHFEKLGPESRPEELYMIALRVIALGLNPTFNTRVVATIKLQPGNVDTCNPKGLNRALTKMLSPDENREAKAPRPAKTIDWLRVLADGKTTADCIQIAIAIAEAFGGAAMTKYLADLSPDEQAGRFHILPLMISVVVDDDGKSIGDLFSTAPAVVVASWENFQDNPPAGVPLTQWLRDYAKVMDILKGPAASITARMFGEVQILSTGAKKIREVMHEPYKGYRNPTAAMMATDFAKEPTMRTVEKTTSLCAAAQMGWLDEVTRLTTDLGRTALMRGDKGTPLFLAAQNNRYDVVRYLVDRPESFEYLNLPEPRSKATPLYSATQAGNVEIVRKLASAGAAVNSPNAKGACPVHMAVYHNFVDVLQVLIKFKADLTKEKKGYNAAHSIASPAHLAISMGRSEILKVLAPLTDLQLPAANGASLLEHAVRAPATVPAAVRAAMIKTLIAANADVNSPNQHDGSTALHYAVTLDGDESLVPLLVERNADVNAVNKLHVTPLHRAAARGLVDILGYLLDHGASPHVTARIRDNHAVTPIAEAKYHLPADHEAIALLQDAMGIPGAKRYKPRKTLDLEEGRLGESSTTDDVSDTVAEVDAIEAVVDLTKGNQPGSAGISFDAVPGHGGKITNVLPGAAADVAGKVKVGMFIVGTDAHTRDMSKDDICMIIRNAGDKVALQLECDVEVKRPPLKKTVVIDVRQGNNPGSVGFNFEVIPGQGCRISAIAEGGAASLVEKLKVKMYIVAVNGTDIRNMTKDDVGGLIGASGDKVGLLCEKKRKALIEKKVEVVVVDKTRGNQPGSTGLSFDAVPGQGGKIANVMPGAAADVTGKVKVGMCIIGVLRVSTRDMSKDQMSMVIRAAAGDFVNLWLELGSSADEAKMTLLQIMVDRSMSTMGPSLGIAFELSPNKDSAIITTVKPGFAAAVQGELKSGMCVVAVNGNSVVGLEKQAVVGLLRERNDVTFSVAQPPEGGASKENTIIQKDPIQISIDRNASEKGKSLGIAFDASPEGAGILITAIRSGFAADVQGDLKAGMIVLAVNGVSVVGADKAAARELLTERDNITLTVTQFENVDADEAEGATDDTGGISEDEEVAAEAPLDDAERVQVAQLASKSSISAPEHLMKLLQRVSSEATPAKAGLPPPQPQRARQRPAAAREPVVQQAKPAPLPLAVAAASDQPWLHPTMTNPKAESLLSGMLNEPGYFLVREHTPSSHIYVISVVYRGKPTHHRCDAPPNSQSKINKAPTGVTGLAATIDLIRSKHIFWPVPLTQHVPN